MLVVYYAEAFPLRTSIADHLYSLKRYGDCATVYLNAAVRALPAWAHRWDPDLVVFHTSVLAVRWHPPTFAAVRRRLAPLRGVRGPRVAIPQDEFIYTDPLCEFLREFRVSDVFTCADEQDVRTIYGDLADSGIRFCRVLTGYLDPGTVQHIESLSDGVANRSVDIAYRAWRPEYWLGRHAQLKGTIADAFEQEAPRSGLSTDISVHDADTLLGDAWYRLLLQSRWTIGVEGGAGIIDRDGAIRARTLDYCADHPGATFDEVEAACFPGRDGELGLLALSPRHLEACATRTAQALVEGEYNGVLRAGEHYLALRPDLSNLSEVLSEMADDSLRAELADRAYHDIVATRRYDYGQFAARILGARREPPNLSRSRLQRTLIAWDAWLDGPSWHWVRVRQHVRPVIRSILTTTGLLGPVRRIRDQLGGRSQR